MIKTTSDFVFIFILGFKRNVCVKPIHELTIHIPYFLIQLPRQLFFFGSWSAAIIQGRKLFKGGNYCFMTNFDTLTLLRKDFDQLHFKFYYSQTQKFCQQLCFFFTKTSYFLAICFKKIYFLDSSDTIFLAKSNIISELKEKPA